MKLKLRWGGEKERRRKTVTIKPLVSCEATVYGEETLQGA
jgi:hypothetical protein